MTWADDAGGAVRRAMRLSLNQIGREIVADIRESIGTPVVNGVRSEPGEPPYKETGDLQRAISYRVESKAKSIEAMTVFVSDDKNQEKENGPPPSVVAKWLELGTRKMEPRPFFAPARRRAGNLKQRLKDLLAERLNNTDPFGRKAATEEMNPNDGDIHQEYPE